jgi:hypothetical protein
MPSERPGRCGRGARSRLCSGKRPHVLTDPRPVCCWGARDPACRCGCRSRSRRRFHRDARGRLSPDRAGCFCGRRRTWEAKAGHDEWRPTRACLDRHLLSGAERRRNGRAARTPAQVNGPAPGFEGRERGQPRTAKRSANVEPSAARPMRPINGRGLAVFGSFVRLAVVAAVVAFAGCVADADWLADVEESLMSA